MRTSNSKLILALALLFFIVSSNSAWAIYTPEPQSGGRFFYSKGTKAAAETRLNRTSPGDYSNFQDYEYGKGLQYKNLRITPGGGYTGVYDSNVYLTEDDEQADYINRMTWNVDFDLPMEGDRYFLTGGVEGVHELFMDESNQDHNDFNYHLGGEMNFNAFTFSVYDEFKDTSDRSGQEFTDRIERKENFLTGLLTIPFGQFFSETEANHYIVRYDDSPFDQFDRQEVTVMPRLGIDVGAKTQALVEYGIKDTFYDDLDDRDSIAHQAQAGLRGFLGKSDLVSYQLWGGWQIRNYDNDEDFSNVIARGEVLYKPSQVTTVRLAGTRTPVESIEATQNFYTRNEVSLMLRRQVAEKLFVRIQGAAGINEYEGDRDDFIVEPRGGLEYILPGNVLAFFAEYKFTARFSDATARDYNRHQVSVGIKAEV